MLLAPTVNLHRTPIGGRNFECMSEDPYLTACIAVGYVRGLQAERGAACIKHFVCNDQEFERFSMDSEFSGGVFSFSDGCSLLLLLKASYRNVLFAKSTSSLSVSR